MEKPPPVATIHLARDATTTSSTSLATIAIHRAPSASDLESFEHDHELEPTQPLKAHKRTGSSGSFISSFDEEEFGQVKTALAKGRTHRRTNTGSSDGAERQYVDVSVDEYAPHLTEVSDWVKQVLLELAEVSEDGDGATAASPPGGVPTAGLAPAGFGTSTLAGPGSTTRGIPPAADCSSLASSQERAARLPPPPASPRARPVLDLSPRAQVRMRVQLSEGSGPCQ